MSLVTFSVPPNRVAGFPRPIRKASRPPAVKFAPREPLFRPGCAQLRCDLLIFRLRQLSPWRRSSRRFSSKRGYDVKMGMVNGLAAAEPVILWNSKTGCSQPFLLSDRRFLHGRQKVTHLIWLKVQEISRAQPFRDHQHVA